MLIYIKRIIKNFNLFLYALPYKLSKNHFRNKFICKKKFLFQKIKIYREVYHFFTNVKLINNLYHDFLACLIN